MKNILRYLIIKLDTFYTYLYPEIKNNINSNYELLNDYSKLKINYDFGDFINVHGKQAVKELYTILNDNYNQRLSDLIAKGDSEEISKLKYLHLILLDIQSILNNNY